MFGKAKLLVPLAIVLGVSNTDLEDGTRTATFAKVVIHICVTYIGAYLSLAQLAKNYKVYSDKTDSGRAPEGCWRNFEPPSNFIDKLITQDPLTVLQFICIVGSLSYCGDGDPWSIISVTMKVMIVWAGMPVISEILECMEPCVSQKLQAISIIKKEWISHDRDLNANDLISVLLGCIILYTSNYRCVNLPGILLTIGVLMKAPCTSVREAAMFIIFVQIITMPIVND